MKIAIVVSSLRPGGVERLCANMANYWAGQHSVSLLTLYGIDESECFAVASDIDVHRLDIAGVSRGPIQGLSNNLNRVRVLRRSLVAIRPDIVLSFSDLTNILVLFATLGTGIPVIAYEQTDPTRWNIGRAWTGLRRLIYGSAGAVVVVNEPARRYFSWLGDRVHVLRNPIEIPPGFSATRRDRTILALGRLSHEKGHDLLIDAFAGVHREIPDWNLVIAGGGPLLESLTQRVAALDLNGRVVLTGRVKDPFELFGCAGLFVQPSRFEGFPLTLCEAMACGLPSICFDAEWSRSIVQSGVNGLLVSPMEPGALGECLRELVTHPETRDRLAGQASRLRDDLSMASVMPLWENLVAGVVGAAPRRSQDT